jgi:VWFA-related protein
MLGLLPWAVPRAEQAQTPPATPRETQQPAFRSGIQIVEVDARVFDRNGRFVTGLTAEDFELLEDGVAQQIQALYWVDGPSAVLMPLPSAEAAAPEASPSSATGTSSPEATARHTWIFFFDLNHLTPGAGFDRARKAVEDFLRDRFREGDIAGVVAGGRMVNNRMTSERDELVQAVKSVKPLSDRRSLQIELTREFPRLLDEAEALRIARNDREALARAVQRACSDDPSSYTCERAEAMVREKAARMATLIHRATADTMSALNGLAGGLARIPGPKTLVFLSDGFVVDRVETTLRSIVGQTTRAGARVYAIDVRGLNRGRGAGIIDQFGVDDEAGPVTRFDELADAPNSLAVDTGGIMIRNENNIGRALDRIAEDSGRYYVLAYAPPNQQFDGGFRTIQVRVKRDGLRVRARRGYLALPPSQMLVPRPIKGTGDLEAAPGATAAAVPSPAPPTPPSPAGAAPSGSVSSTPAPPGAPSPASAPPAAPTSTIRLRPDAAGRVATLRAGETAADLAARGWSAYQRGDAEEAYPLLVEASERPDVRPWVIYARGLAEAVLEKPADAVASWERVRRAAPGFFEVHMDLADTYMQLGESSKALAVLRDAQERWPQKADVHNAIGVIHVKRGALDDAIAAFERATAAEPLEGLGWLNLGRAYELRYARGRRYVTSQRRWVAPEDDRRKAAESYERCIAVGGHYASQAQQALSILRWQS